MKSSEQVYRKVSELSWSVDCVATENDNGQNSCSSLEEEALMALAELSSEYICFVSWNRENKQSTPGRWGVVG